MRLIPCFFHLWSEVTRTVLCDSFKSAASNQPYDNWC